MQWQPCCLVAALLLLPTAALHAQVEEPALVGYVTNSGTPQSFQLNGYTVHCDARTIATSSAVEGEIGSRTCILHNYGEHLAVFGKINGKSHSILATEISPLDKLTSRSVEGIALIDQILGPDTFRADGLAFRKTTGTKITWANPLTPASGIHIQQWVEYHGKLDDKGSVVATHLIVSEPNVSPDEQKLRDKNDFDPSSVTDEDRQDPLAKLFIGTDYTRIPAMKDPTLQSRIEQIGKRLVPAYESNLPDSNPNKIDFRFQLVDTHWKQCVGLPSGVMLVPASLVRRFSDDELAPVIAYAMAAVLEKQAYRYAPVGQTLTGIGLAGDALGFVVPGLGLLTGVGTGVTAHKIQLGYELQCDRMSLVLLHDGGFDVQQAPLTWWRLHTSKREFMNSNMPNRSMYLFQAIASFWTPASPLLSSPSLPQSSASD